MISALQKYKYLIIIVVVISLGFVGYTYLVQPADFGSSTMDKTSTEGVINDLGKSFVDQLLRINNINLKLDFFKDPTYLGLQDHSKEITPKPRNRPNPFAPVGQEGNSPATEYQDISGKVIKSTEGLNISDTETTNTITPTNTTKPTTTKKGTTKTP